MGDFAIWRYWALAGHFRPLGCSIPCMTPSEIAIGCAVKFPGLTGGEWQGLLVSILHVDPPEAVIAVVGCAYLVVIELERVQLIHRKGIDTPA